MKRFWSLAIAILATAILLDQVCRKAVTQDLVQDAKPTINLSVYRTNEASLWKPPLAQNGGRIPVIRNVCTMGGAYIPVPVPLGVDLDVEIQRLDRTVNPDVGFRRGRSADWDNISRRAVAFQVPPLKPATHQTR